ncbi:MAG: MBL fold metallo-hydrolase [Acholeplasmataceae bacterium]|nr:MBL fold metallo-hydrolase [Acholeplasmataceae bacterium]
MDNITNNVYYIGVNDYKTDLFEGQYPLPKGIAYNSYVIVDEKIAVLDTVEAKFYEEWQAKLKAVLKDRIPDYLIIHHMEPDHSANIQKFLETYPNVQIVGNNKTFRILEQFFPDLLFKPYEVVEGSAINLGSSVLHFYNAPMVHWPEVIVSYLQPDNILFSTDAFGRFGALDQEEEWIDEARRYYFGIVGKYGAQVQNLLARISFLEIDYICSLHGPILKGDARYYLDLYDRWSKYEPELRGTFIAYASMYGNTKAAAYRLYEGLKAKGEPVEIIDLGRADIFTGIAKAFAYPKLIIASPTYNTKLFPAVERFVQGIVDRNYQRRSIGIIENGSWGPFVEKRIREKFEASKDISYFNTVVSIRSSMNANSLAEIQALIDEIV